ncbi:FtsX-like permease family protein [Streptomyces sp. bgisy159]|uniref:FtsX-like permease family protein n=1 Tax=Streptomyces sp. bgisy159 TaxID=3413795 RepID=UPI003F4A48BF
MRPHRPLLAAALLTVLLTTAVLAALTAYSGAIGDAALRHSLARPRNAADTALVVTAEVPADRRAAADTAVREGARKAFDGLSVTVRTLVRSGPYGLPRSLQPPEKRSGDPDLTHFAALDRSQLRLASGHWPRAADDTGAIEAALPQPAARVLGVEPGTRIHLADRLGGPPVDVVVTGLYRPLDPAAPYWRLDALDGRGVKKSSFTTYGPLLADPSVVTGGRVSAGPSGWLASADFASLTTGRLDALGDSARSARAALRADPALNGGTATTALPDVVDRVQRSLLVSRSTLLVVALQLALLAVCALLLVARLLSTERLGETRLLRSRGASGGQLAALAALEAVLLAVPALVLAPLLAAPATRLLSAWGAPARIGLHLDVPVGGRTGVWLVTAGVALTCALAVSVPALTGSGLRERRARALPMPLRAGADLGLVAVAGVSYWQLDRRTSGAVAPDRGGALGIDPLLVAAPALLLLAGTVLTLRLLPPVARLAERRATSGRGLTSALAGWQVSRRPMRGAGPVLLLVLAVALGMLAIGQVSSWGRSQEDQADFAAGAPLRVLGAGDGELGRTQEYGAVPHVAAVAPAVRSTLPVAGDRTATVLALDTERAADTVLMRPDLAPAPARELVAGLAPKGTAVGAAVPADSTRLVLTATLRSSVAGSESAPTVALTVQDDHGTPYRLPVGRLPADGRPHRLTLELGGGQGELTLTGAELVLLVPSGRAEHHTLTLDALSAAGTDGTAHPVPLPTSWTASSATDGQVSSRPSPDAPTRPAEPRVTTGPPLTLEYGTGYVPAEEPWLTPGLTVRLHVPQPPAGAVTALATDRFLTATGARPGQSLDITFEGQTVPVRIGHAVRELPTAGPAEEASGDGGALLLDLRAVNRVLQQCYGVLAAPTEWWLRPGSPGATAQVAAALRARPDMDPAQVVVRDEIAAELRDDPFGAGPEAAFTAAAGAAAVLAALGFAVSAAGSLRERDAEFAVLRALGAPRRRLARTVAAEHGVLVALALAVGTALGTVLTRSVLPLIVLTGQATRPVPDLLVELPPTRVAALLAAVAVVPVLVTAVLSVRRADPVQVLREAD